MRYNMYLVGVGYILEVVFSVFSSCISSKNNFFEDQNHRAPVISFLKIEAPIQKIPCRPRFFFLPVTLLFIRNRNNHSMDYYRLKKKSPEILLCNSRAGKVHQLVKMKRESADLNTTNSERNSSLPRSGQNPTENSV